MFATALLSSILDDYQASIAAAGPLYCIARRFKFACCSVPAQRSTPTETVLGCINKVNWKAFAPIASAWYRVLGSIPATFLYHP